MNQHIPSKPQNARGVISDQRLTTMPQTRPSAPARHGARDRSDLIDDENVGSKGVESTSLSVAEVRPFSFPEECTDAEGTVRHLKDLIALNTDNLLLELALLHYALERECWKHARNDEGKPFKTKEAFVGFLYNSSRTTAFQKMSLGPIAHYLWEQGVKVKRIEHLNMLAPIAKKGREIDPEKLPMVHKVLVNAQKELGANMTSKDLKARAKPHYQTQPKAKKQKDPKGNGDGSIFLPQKIEDSRRLIRSLLDQIRTEKQEAGLSREQSKQLERISGHLSQVLKLWTELKPKSGIPDLKEDTPLVDLQKETASEEVSTLDREAR